MHTPTTELGESNAPTFGKCPHLRNRASQASACSRSTSTDAASIPIRTIDMNAVMMGVAHPNLPQNTGGTDSSTSSKTLRVWETNANVNGVPFIRSA